jgi:transposase InsO family protein
VRPSVKYEAIYRNQYEYNVSFLCKFFEVSRSGYYAWLAKRQRPDKDDALAGLIRECQKKSRQTYGYRRVKQWLVREKGLAVNKKTVLRVMQKYNLLAEIRRPRGFFTSHPYRYVSYVNLLQRDFHAERPNEKWATDISYIHTKQGRLYLSVIKDLYDRSIVAYELASYFDSRLVLDTVKKATGKLCNGTILHSDQGSQYGSNEYAALSRKYKFNPSMSKPGTPLDNASVESFFSTLKAECIYRHTIDTPAHAKELIRKYIYFYNYERIHSAFGCPPMEKRRSAA